MIPSELLADLDTGPIAMIEKAQMFIWQRGRVR